MKKIEQLYQDERPQIFINNLKKHKNGISQKKKDYLSNQTLKQDLQPLRVPREQPSVGLGISHSETFF